MDSSEIFKQFDDEEIKVIGDGSAIYKGYRYTRLNSAYNRRAKDVCTHTREEWLELCEKYDFKCCKCKSEVLGGIPTRDHIIPKSLGGTDSIKNLQPLCRECNTSKWMDIRDYR